MNEKELRHFEAIKKILEMSQGIDFHTLQFQVFATENKIEYYTFASMKHVGLLEIKRKGRLNWIRATIRPDELEPIHVTKVLEDIRKTVRAFKSRKKEVVSEVEKAVSGVKSELEALKEETEERNRYPYMDKATLVAVRVLQDMGYTVSLRKVITVEHEFTASTGGEE